jgi:HSP20 family molecular chaperone IbpA
MKEVLVMSYVPEKRNSVFDDLMENVFEPFDMPAMNSLMKTDIRKKDDKYLLDIDLPGYNKEDIKISLYNGTLNITAEHHDTQEDKDKKGNVLRQERYSGACSRSYYVGEGIKDSDVHASYKDGILTVEVPTEEKKEQEEKKYIDIL